MSQMTPDEIRAAIKAGIITPAKGKALLGAAHNGMTETGPLESAAIGDEENLRFLRGFSDVFIAIGMGLLALGLSALAALLGGGLSFIGAAAIMALLAEYFGRKRRAHLPTLICALAFLLFTQRGVGVLVYDWGWGAGLTTSVITAAAMVLFYLRVRLPFCIALIAVSLLYLCYSLLFRAAPNWAGAHFGWVLFSGGLGCFITALLYDIKDLHRKTRFSDNAFWLHFTAAPLIIHGLALEAVSLKSEMLFNLVPVVTLTDSDAFIILLIVAVIILIGLAINRRALIVSSLGYAAIAIGFLAHKTGAGFGMSAAMALLCIGAGIVLLGAAWHGLRNRLITLLPKWRIFPPPYDPDFKA